MEEQVINVQEQVSEMQLENMSNETLANVVAKSIKYRFPKAILVKPLEAEKVTKTLTVPEDSGEKDENGDPIMQMTIKQVEVDSVYRKGIVIAMPTSTGDANLYDVKIGDTIVYPDRYAVDFDLYKDSALVEPFYIVAVADNE